MCRQEAPSTKLGAATISAIELVASAEHAGQAMPLPSGRQPATFDLTPISHIPHSVHLRALRADASG